MVPEVPIQVPEQVPDPVKCPPPGPEVPRRSSRTRTNPERLKVTGNGKSYADMIKLNLRRTRPTLDQDQNKTRPRPDFWFNMNLYRYFMVWPEILLWNNLPLLL